MTTTTKNDAATVMKIVPIKRHEHPNAVCGVCRLPTRRGGGRLVAAVAKVVRGPHQHYVCAGHAQVASVWARLVRLASERDVAAQVYDYFAAFDVDRLGGYNDLPEPDESAVAILNRRYGVES